MLTASAPAGPASFAYMTTRVLQRHRFWAKTCSGAPPLRPAFTSSSFLFSTSPSETQQLAGASSGSSCYLGDDSGEVWQSYTELMSDVMQADRVLRKRKKITEEQIQAVQAYLLEKVPLEAHDIGPPPSILSRMDQSEETQEDDAQQKLFRNQLQTRQEEFRQHTNFTSEVYEYCGRSLSYLADICAKGQQTAPCLIAWSKIIESGLIPLENTLSTYMYVLSMDNDKIVKGSALQQQQTGALLEVAAFHEILYGPNEKSVTLRIKTLVANGDAAAAEDWLNKHYDGGQEKKQSLQPMRLRTYAPILEYYCEEGDIESALRLYQDMQQSEGVHLDAETYARIIGSTARHGWFRLPREQQPTAAQTCDLTQYGFSASPGPELLDELMERLAEDLLEVDEASANVLLRAFEDGFAANADTGGEDKPRVVATRVSVDNTTAICPETNVKLRLFTLTEEQKRLVHDNLLQMAAVEHEDYFGKIQARKPQAAKIQNKTRDGGQVAVKELSKFSDWLRVRVGEPFTAFVDGPNVGYFGSGDMKWDQVQLVVDKLESMGENPLVIMPQKYVASSFSLSRGSFQKLSEEEMAVMKSLIEKKKVYVVPPDCFDDYYWMLSSVAVQERSEELRVSTDDDSGRFPGLRPMIVTNDQMRDHRLDLIEPRLFRRWTSCHMVKYSIRQYEPQYRDVVFFPADFFSREIQRNAAVEFGNSTAWHIPVSEWPGRDRLCLMIVK